MTQQARTWPAKDSNGRNHVKVHAGSREAAWRERPDYITEDQRRARIIAFKVISRTTRPEGRRRGYFPDDEAAPFSYSLHCADVFEFLMSFAVKTGMIYPSYKSIAKAVGCTVRSAFKAVAQLARGGWLEWERRFVRIGAANAKEPQVHQATNFYRLKLPDAAIRIIASLVNTARGRRADPAWTPDAPNPERTGDVRNAIFKARDAAKRQDNHLLLDLAWARTPQAVAAVLLKKEKLAAALDALGESINRPKPSPA